jgi:hypothetical protein
MIKSNHKISTKFKNQAGRLYTKEIRVFGNSKNRTGASLSQSILESKMSNLTMIF